MLDSNTKKRIDDLRNILVGKIPSPQSQVEQITTGLIYKFMYDMDDESVKDGGVPSFFVGEFEKYSWKNLFDPKLSGVDKVQLYSDAIENMYTNPSAPQLFREIFKNSFLPFKDPSTLNMFLKEINEFHYSHSEKLGDAFEYLLSFMGSQGDAGQFRTPRHIIDFIIDIVNPQKNETILDPACGTAGFLISSFKHILNQNTDKRVGDKLNAAERKQVGDNLVGYDISPDMTRISLVNMYLHQFASPQIHEYDTLSSEDKWNEYYNVILANPPFFSPKGGIQPHKRFGVESSRAEVLFVDYIMEHLKPNGRAGIVVPEGVIFQTGKAYKTLRKKLVEDCLVGVISLPAGVFQPYSGVKTSILILDKELNQKSDSVFFAKVENDGFSLGAQRSPIDKNDLPSILQQIKNLETLTEFQLIQSVSKDIIVEKKFSLSAGLFLKKFEMLSDYKIVKLGDVCRLINGRAYKKSELLGEGKYPVLRVGNFFTNPRWYYSDLELDYDKYCRHGDLLYAWSASFGAKIWDCDKTIYHYHIWKLVPDEVKVNKLYLKYLLDFMTDSFKESEGRGGIMLHLTKSGMENQMIPLPPIEVQQEIVDELEGYQKIIDGCRQVVDNYKPTIDIDPSWKMVDLGELVEVKGGKRLPKGEPFSDTPTQHPYIRVSDFKDFSIDATNLKFITNEVYEQISRYIISSDDVYISIAGTIGLVGEIPKELSGSNLTENAAKLVLKTDKISKDFLVYISATSLVQTQIQSRTHAVGVPKLALERIKTIEVPVPSIEEQREIIDTIKQEIDIVNGTSRLIDKYNQKIQDRISKVWSE